eukprot:TRINITY_DN61824_c0_g1_i1.p1 TRINITY_DN61824_c0_g1~~TRINITY_DN61824_c0_g1_i1.p1  ORF type:complete len:270 (+),score=50.05 TRINITY_DN61824_c0_g1_i1:142-951(+)
MTLLQKTRLTVEILERLLADVVALLPRPSASARSDGSGGLFEFVPPLRTVTHEVHTKFTEILQRFGEMEDSVHRLRKKCSARVELDAVLSQLRNCIPGSPDDVVTVARELIESGGQHADIAAPLLERALKLESEVTYGVKMNAHALELFERFDAAQVLFNKEIVPRVSMAVKAAEAELEEMRNHEAELAKEEATRRSIEAMRPLQELVEASERLLRVHREREAFDERQSAERLHHQESPLPLPTKASPSRSSGGNNVPTIPAVCLRSFS